MKVSKFYSKIYRAESDTRFRNSVMWKVMVVLCAVLSSATPATFQTGPIVGNCVGNPQLIRDFCTICGGSSAGLCKGNLPYACCQNTTSQPPKASPCSGCTNGYTLCNAQELCTKYVCINATCTRTTDGTTGVSKDLCNSACGNSALYQCVSGTCVIAASGVNRTTCAEMCRR
eukprot:m.349565 g.349565  ORF g.349565 m.349565 type:complete len:173 (-) comp16575_c0_seq3:119-637(-)